MTTTSNRLGFKDARRQLLVAQKTSKGAPAYSRFINRPLGRQLAAIAYHLGLRPNQVTAASALCTFAAIALIVSTKPTVASCVALVFLLVIGYALDAADGQLARLQGSGSAGGEWLDHVIDSIKISSLHLAVLVCWFRFYEVNSLWYLVPIVFQCVASVQFFAMILTDQLRRAHRGTTSMLLKGSGNSSMLYSMVVMPTDYGLLCIVLGILCWPTGFLVVYTCVMLANLMFVLLALPKWFREVKRLV